MAPLAPPPPSAPLQDSSGPVAPAIRLRLYIARSTPNSIRAEQNLSLALDVLKDRSVIVEVDVIDVFSQPKRALTDGVVITPTLICLARDKRVLLLGDLQNQSHLIETITSLHLSDHAADPLA